VVSFIDNIFVSFGGTLFQQVVGIPMGTNCAPLLADLFLYSYQSEFLQKLVKDKKIHEARAFNFTYRYIVSQMKMTFQEIRIIATGPCIANQLRDVNTICRRSWYIAAHVWKIYDFKIEVYRYIDDVLSINNSRFAEFLPLIYPPELEVKETTDTASFASFLDLYLECFCRDGIYFDKILVSEYKLFKRSNKANLFIALV
jgi:hypothetical protein